MLCIVYASQFSIINNMLTQKKKCSRASLFLFSILNSILVMFIIMLFCIFRSREVTIFFFFLSLDGVTLFLLVLMVWWLIFFGIYKETEERKNTLDRIRLVRENGRENGVWFYETVSILPNTSKQNRDNLWRCRSLFFHTYAYVNYWNLC